MLEGADWLASCVRSTVISMIYRRSHMGPGHLGLMLSQFRPTAHVRCAEFDASLR